MTFTDIYPYIRDSVIIAATASAALVAYNNYRKQKRHEMTASIRKMVTHLDYNCNRLNELLNYEVLHEIISEVVYSHQIDMILTYMANSVTDGTKSEKPELARPVTTSIHSPILEEYENLLKSNSEICGQLAEAVPSIHRIFLSINTMFVSIIRSIKEFSRNENALVKIYFQIRNTGCHDIGMIKDEMFYLLLSAIGNGMEVEQLNINDALSIISQTRNAITRLDDKQLGRILKKSRQLKLQSVDSTETIFNDFREAEKGLALIFTPEELLSYRELYIKMKVRKEDR